jgi:hypothetical protein
MARNCKSFKFLDASHWMIWAYQLIPLFICCHTRHTNQSESVITPSCLNIWIHNLTILRWRYEVERTHPPWSASSGRHGVEENFSAKFSNQKPTQKPVTSKLRYTCQDNTNEKPSKRTPWLCELCLPKRSQRDVPNFSTGEESGMQKPIQNVRVPKYILQLQKATFF